MLVCDDVSQAVNALESTDSTRSNHAERVDQPVVMMFSGQGSQYVNMARGLYQHEKVFREHVDRCSEILFPHLKLDLRNVIYHNEEQSKLNQTFLAQPALFVIEYSLAQLWMSWGVRPEAMIGHSVGEYVAACLAGVISLEDALMLVAARGHFDAATAGRSDVGRFAWRRRCSRASGSQWKTISRRSQRSCAMRSFWSHRRC